MTMSPHNRLARLLFLIDALIHLPSWPARYRRRRNHIPRHAALEARNVAA